MELLDRVIKANRDGSTVVEMVEGHLNCNPLLTQVSNVCGLTTDFNIESGILNELKRLCGFQQYWIQPNRDEKLDEDQWSAVQGFFNSNLTVLCGSGGSGKTKVITVVVSELLRSGIRAQDIALISPLGVIANKLSIKTGIAAYTVNRLLEYSPIDGITSDSTGVIEFIARRNETNPLSQSFFIIDESTLLTNELSYSLLKAIPTGARLMLAGDIKQLLGVGKGQIFKDLVQLADKVTNLYHLFSLKSNYRNKDTLIERFSEYVSNPIYPMKELYLSMRGPDLIYISTENDDETARLIINKFKVLKNRNPDLISQVQVLSPEHDGVIGTLALNEKIMELEAEKNLIGTRVMFKKNNYRKQIFNGQPATIESFSGDRVIIASGSRSYAFPKNMLWEIVKLAYVLTPNSCQGAEFSLVIIIIPHKFTHIDRSWLYAGSTRAKQSLVIIGSDLRLDHALTQNANRDTFIKYLFGAGSR